MEFNVYVLIMAVLSLATGLILYIWLVRSNASYFFATNVISWLLVALFPVLLIFSFFPDSSFAGTIKGVSMGGAIGAFIFIWWYGTKIANQVSQVDKHIEDVRNDLSAKLEAREEKLAQLEELLEEDQKQQAPTVLQETKIYPYRLKGERRKRIALITGDIRKVKVADIWVNSENTNMQMSRFYERSISAIIRYLGAKKDNVGNVSEDIIANELAEIMGDNLAVQPATVLATGAGELQRTHNVKRIFHVASVHGEIGVGYKPIDNIEFCVTNALEKADSEELKSLGLKSILFPLMGTGGAKGNLKEIAGKLIHAAISYMETAENGTLEDAYFLMWIDIELDTCKAILDESDKLKALKG
jgi:O-acetyl-ADP-ribose deacetylase (regulator of RNase III)